MNKYLTTKLAEEAAEVAQAACKVLLHQDEQAREVLLSEMADMQAMLNIARAKLRKWEKPVFAQRVTEREERERKKGKV